MKNPLVTVIITTYKRPGAIGKAINSVRGQTYKNLEIIVVDDNMFGSFDHLETEKICTQYPEVQYVKNAKNLGGGLSRNAGIEQASGEYIAFLDDDDIYNPDKVKQQMGLFKTTNNKRLGLVYCYANRMNTEGALVGGYDNDFEGSPLYEHMLACIAGTSLWLVKKEILVAIGMFDDVPSKQDSTVILKMLTKGYEVARVPERLVDYYEHKGDGISGTKLSNIKGIKKFRDKCELSFNLLDKNQIKNVRYSFSKTLISIYMVNSLKKEAINEFKIMVQNRPLRLNNISSLMKIVAPNLYIKYLGMVGYLKDLYANRFVKGSGN